MDEKRDVIEYFLDQLQVIETYMIRMDKAYEKLLRTLKDYIENE